MTRRSFPSRLLSDTFTLPLVREAENAYLNTFISASTANSGTINMAALSRAPDGLRTLAFFSHVEADIKALATAAGFDLVIVETAGTGQADTEIVDLAMLPHSE